MSDDPSTDMVPRERLNAKNAELRQVRQQLAALEAAKAGLEQQVAALEIVSGQVEALTSERDTAVQRYDRYSAAASNGLTDPGIVELAEWQYGRLAADDRPEFGDWLSALVADPSTAPAGLRAELTAVTAAPVVAEAPTPEAPTAPKPPGARVHPAAPSRNAPSPTKLSGSEIDAAVKRGDYASIKEQVHAQYTSKRRLI